MIQYQVRWTAFCLDYLMKAEQMCIFPRISEKIADVVVFKLSLEAETLSDLNLSCSQKHGRSTQV